MKRVGRDAKWHNKEQRFGIHPSAFLLIMKPNVVFVFADQWRAQAAGYAGDPNVQTPNIDALAARSVNFTNAVASIPVCCPYRASLLTGQHPLTHGVFMNDVSLRPTGPTIAEAFAGAGYDTAYIGKWHVDGQGRSTYIPPERRFGFDYWKVLECIHNYNESYYYAGDSDEKLRWDGYDAFAQTRDAQTYIASHGHDQPFLLMLSWGPPHNPYETAPPEFAELYNADSITLRDNVPPEMAANAREWLAGYYAHCTALDKCVGDLLETLRTSGLEDDTIFVFASDHGDMLGSQGQTRKQRPWDESIRVPFLLHYPGLNNWLPRPVDVLIDAPDIMPTLLGLCGIAIPDSVEGNDYSGVVRGEADPTDGAAMLIMPQPFGEWTPQGHGGKEYRGLRTKRYTFVRDLDGPWLLFDNETDPNQLENLVGNPEHAELQAELESWLQRKLAARGDEFLPGAEYVKRWGYTVDASGTVPYKW